MIAVIDRRSTTDEIVDGFEVINLQNVHIDVALSNNIGGENYIRFVGVNTKRKGFVTAYSKVGNTEEEVATIRAEAEQHLRDIVGVMKGIKTKSVVVLSENYSAEAPKAVKEEAPQEDAQEDASEEADA